MTSLNILFSAHAWKKGSAWCFLPRGKKTRRKYGEHGNLITGWNPLGVKSVKRLKFFHPLQRASDKCCKVKKNMKMDFVGGGRGDLANLSEYVLEFRPHFAKLYPITAASNTFYLAT